MGHKRLGGKSGIHGSDARGRRTTAVYTIRVYRFSVHGAAFEVKSPSSGFFYLGIWDIGMGLGGVVDRPTDTLPHGVPGVGPC